MSNADSNNLPTRIAQRPSRHIPGGITSKWGILFKGL